MSESAKMTRETDMADATEMIAKVGLEDTTKSPGETGLADATLLDKIDKLRELNVSEHVPLPQVSSQLPLTSFRAD